MDTPAAAYLCAACRQHISGFGICLKPKLINAPQLPVKCCRYSERKEKAEKGRLLSQAEKVALLREQQRAAAASASGSATGGS